MPPILYLRGNSTQLLAQFSSFEEAGYACFDDLDGNITSAVTFATGVYINSSVVGAEYNISYSCSDFSGNVDVLTRQVIITAPAPIVLFSSEPSSSSPLAR